MTDQRPARISSANLEARETLGLLLLHLHGRDLRPAGSPPAELDHLLDRRGITLEDRLDRAIGPISHPSRDPGRFGATPGRVAEEHPLDPPADHDPLAGQGLLLFVVLGGAGRDRAPEDLG